MIASLFAGFLALTHVQANTQFQVPPRNIVRVPLEATSVRVTITTGDDDLRGGNDNADMVLVTRDGRAHRIDNLNGGRSWPNGSTNVRSAAIGGRHQPADFVAVRLETTASGGISGDNWNVARILVEVDSGGTFRPILDRRGQPLVRLTGDRRVIQIPLQDGAEIRTMPVRTNFDPARHGFQFANMFKFPFLAFDMAWAGLCGGMAYTALDHYSSGIRPPEQWFMPPPGHPLYNYIFQRQMRSIETNLDRWTELTVNPGFRNREFFVWGLETGSGRFGELRRILDSGRPAVIGLFDLGLDYYERGEKKRTLKSHQVVAIGYDAGRFYGDPAVNGEDLRIFVYDPNHPRQTRVLRADLRNSYWYYENGTGGQDLANRWRTYFVDTKYAPQRPSIRMVAVPANQVWAQFVTGGDDLRGGNDNVHLVVLLRDGRQIRFENVNEGRRWMNKSVNEAARELPADLRAEDVVGVRLETTFGGGIGGDNWNLDQLFVHFRFGANSGWVTRLEQAGQPLVRFTGDVKTRDFRW